MKLHRTMTVSMRLSLGFGLLIGLLAVVAVTSLVRLQASSKGVNDLALARLPKLAASTTWVESLQQSARLMRDTLILDDEKQIKEAIEIISKGRQQRNDLGAELGKLISTEKEKELLTNIVNVHAEYAPNEDKYLKSASSGDLSTAKDVMLDKVRPAQIKYISAINEFRNLQSTLSGEEAKDIVGSNKASGTLILTLALVALLSGLIAAFLIIRALIRQLGGEPTYAAEVVQQIADGNLANEVIVRQNDTASLLAAMKRMQDNLRGTVLQIKSTAETISNASSEISQGNNDLNGRTAQQASALEQTSASMEQLGATIRQNADNAKQANQLALGASEVAVKGGTVVSEVVDTMKSINESSKKITDIISVIDGIAFQTNILALNAAVEAARAGEQGRGFAVVASEVRNLAQRSASAAKEIKGLIAASVQRVEQGTALVDQAGTTMHEIVDAIAQVTNIMAEIDIASDQQSSGVRQVTEAVVHMDNATQQNATLVEESAAAAESLKAQAQQLVQAVALFKLGHGATLARLR